MTDQHTSSPVTRLLAESLSGKLSRRDVMKRASALGLSAPLVGVMLSAQAHVAVAQDATPGAMGSLITVPEGLPDLSLRLKELYHPIILGIREMEKPVLAAVNGPAVGIGCSLALACDLILAAESSYFLLAFVNIGLVPDGGSTTFVPARTGLARATEMGMLGERVPAEAEGVGDVVGLEHHPGEGGLEAAVLVHLHDLRSVVVGEREVLPVAAQISARRQRLRISTER